MLFYVGIQDEKQTRKTYLRKPAHHYIEKQRGAGGASYNETIFRLEYDFKKPLLVKKNSWKIEKKSYTLWTSKKLSHRAKSAKRATQHELLKMGVKKIIRNGTEKANDRKSSHLQNVI